ncbi:MAG TPA: hypothetical protein VGG26_09005 [Terracidiphilus sp.]
MNQSDPGERAARFLEEAIELAQCFGMSRGEIEKLAAHVYAKRPGCFSQEIAGCGVTLLALSECIAIDFEEVVDAEIHRIYELPVNHFRKRHQRKVDAGIAAPMGAAE